MANLLHTLRRRSPVALGALLLGTVGCAFPHGTTQGDPILGNFNRPIVATPMPERGGMGLDTPAYDGGARIGVSAPDIPTAVENTSGFMSLPQLTSPNLVSGARLPFGTDENLASNRRTPQLGARLMMPNQGPNRVPMVPTNYLVPPQAGPQTVAARAPSPVTLITSGSAIAPVGGESEVKQAKYQSPRELVRVQTVEEGQSLLQNIGVKWQRMEQVEGGDWVFSCTVGTKQYESRAADKVQAIRAVVETIQNEK